MRFRILIGIASEQAEGVFATGYNRTLGTHLTSGQHSRVDLLVDWHSNIFCPTLRDRSMLGLPVNTEPVEDAPMETNGQRDNTETQMPHEATRRIESLRAMTPKHIRVAKGLMTTVGIFELDFVAVAALHRSIALISAFCDLVERQNPLAAIPLVRLQIDSVMRFNACRLTPNTRDVAKAMLDDKPLHKLKSSDGKALTDRYLYEAAAEHFPWIPEVYRQTSGFVHLSGRHITAPMTAVHDTGVFEMFIGPTQEWRASDMLEAIAAFGEATACLLALCESWLYDKECHEQDAHGS